MSLLLQGASPRRNESGKIRALTMEIFPNVPTIDYQNKNFMNGTLGMLMASESSLSRVGADTDTSMRIFSGMISSDPSKHPKWETALMQRVSESENFAIGYVAPNQEQNFSKLSVEVESEDTVEKLSAPGAWSLQLAADNNTHFYELVDHVLQITLLQDGWQPTGTPVYLSIYIYIYRMFL